MRNRCTNFIEYFEKLRKPTPEDANEDSLNRVALDMGIGIKTAQYHLRLAIRPEIQYSRETDCACPECVDRRFQAEMKPER